MKITKSQLELIIKEETRKTIDEGLFDIFKRKPKKKKRTHCHDDMEVNPCAEDEICLDNKCVKKSLTTGFDKWDSDTLAPESETNWMQGLAQMSDEAEGERREKALSADYESSKGLRDPWEKRSCSDEYTRKDGKPGCEDDEDCAEGRTGPVCVKITKMYRENKISKKTLDKIIVEEIKKVIKEAKAFALSSKHMPIRPIGAKITGIADPDTDEDDADELRSGLDLTGFKLKKMQGMYAIVDAKTDEVVLGPFRTEAQAQERMSDPNLSSDYEAAKQIRSTRAGDYSLAEEEELG